MEPIAGRLPGAAAALIAGALALAACTKHSEPETYAPPPPPPPAPEQPPLAGPPTADTQARADVAVRQAQDDAYLANLPDGLIVTPRTDANGRTIYVISNRPIANPAWHSHPAVRAHRAQLAGASAPPKLTPGLEAKPVASAAQASSSASPTVASAPVASAMPAPAATPRPSSAPATTAAPAKAGFMGVTLPPILWVVLGLLLLLGVLFSILSGQRRKRRPREAHA